MSRTQRDDTGITLIEVFIAMFLLLVAVLATLSVQPATLRLASNADHLGRACGLMENEMESLALKIMNANTEDPTILSDAAIQTIYAGGGEESKPGDGVFYRNTQITKTGSTLWQVRIKITWPGTNTGITQTRLMTRQDDFTK